MSDETSVSWTHSAPSDSTTFVQVWCACGAATVADITSGIAAITCECGRGWLAEYPPINTETLGGA